ncbi:MAG: ABC transporter substrate-binding protein [Candidatus Coproplasma sp.]
MKKIFKGMICAGLCGALALTGLVGCKKNDTIESAHRNAETQPLKLAIGAVDRKFNPMFYTSANDGTIANLTQASLLTADKDGNLAFGEDYPTVALDYKETYYDSVGTAIGTGDGKVVSGRSDTNGSTKFEMLIKNGIKFSDGKDLTVMDVLFNLYVYLDPVYSGSSTIYSTKIKGLQAYRQQIVGADEDSTADNSKYSAAAQTRWQAVYDWADNKGTLSEQGKADLAKIKELYLEELTTDWNSISTSWVEAYKDYFFTSAWQVFYFIEGMVREQTTTNLEGSTVRRFEDLNGNGEKDDGERYYTTLDPNEKGEIEHQVFIDDMAEVATADKVADYISKNPGVSEENAKLALEQESAIDNVYFANTDTASGIKFILDNCVTSYSALEYFKLDEMSKDVPEDVIVPNISGIKVRKLTAGEEFNGKTYTDDHDLLSIEIQGVDPKAKWNFSFAVTPMHYYSDASHTAAAMADYTSGKVYAGTASNFGVQFKNNNWFTDVLLAENKTRLPMGAGAYKCCHYSLSSSDVNKDTFFYNYIANYERNEYFTTLGSGIDNAKIKYVTYQVTSDDKIVEALTTGTIDYGTPTATANNQREVNKGNLRQIVYQTGGYGYVGINPAFVPDIEVRQAIMYSFNTASILEYYGGSLVSLINRPMSLTSWASPENDDSPYYNASKHPTRKYELTDAVLNGKSDVEFIKDLIISSGNYYFSKGKMMSYATGAQLELTFTIAGESTDHPSYNMFVESQALLKQCGVAVTVKTDIQALLKLASGKLAVWAAAWQSSIDPDPYQIYSINSNASSTLNWNKDGIVDDPVTFSTEYAIAMELNDLIEQGRETLNQADRASIYAECLELIMDLAVEFPTYQRNDLCVYNASVLDASTMRLDATYNMGPIDELWKVGYRA